MNEVAITRSENKVVIKLFGKVDSVFSSTHQGEIYSSVDQNTDLTIDLKDVGYISSAGLRIILKCAKLAKSIEVIEVNEQVYEVFLMSGFTEIVPVKRAKRELSVEGKELIGEGANGKVYRYDIDTIVKVYKDSSHLEYIENEIAMSKKAFVLGVPTAIPFDIVRIKGGGYGCVYELLKSDVMSNLIIKNPEKTAEYTELFANALSTFLHTETHDNEFPRKMDYPREWVEFYKKSHIFSDDVITKIETLLKTIENGHTLVHGDFHIKNIMFQNGEPIIIDMDTLGVGHPIFEIAYAYYSMVGFDKVHQENSKKFFGIDYSEISKVFFDTFDIVFKNKTSEEKENILKKAMFLSHLRISYRSNHHLPKDPVRSEDSIKYINENIDKLDTLDFEI